MKLLGFLLALVVVLIDQATKVYAESMLSDGTVVRVNSWLNFVLHYNEGAAFSIFADMGGVQRYFLSGISIVASLLLAYWIAKLKPNEMSALWPFSLLLGGAVGNGIDRVLYGKVIDFIQMHYGGYAFPTYNVADMAVSAGAFFLLLQLFIGQKDG